MRYLALDQSSKITGYSVFTDEGLKDYGKFELTDENLDARLVKLRTKILELVEKYSANEIYLEDIQLQDNIGNNVATFKILSEVIGVITETCKEFNIPYKIIPPTVWKAAIGIPTQEVRRVQKKLTQTYVIENYNLKVSEDTSDAIGIGTYVYKTKGHKINKLKTAPKKPKEEGISWSD